jgi:hypothetical protein
MPNDPDVAVIAHVIQLAVAPVFLLAGIGALLNVMTNRLGRVIDRARRLEGLWDQMNDRGHELARVELKILERRGRLASWAINLCTFAALLVCTVVGTLFVDAFLGTNLKWFVGGSFFCAMVVLVGGLSAFLAEVYLATHVLRIGPPDEEGPDSDSKR